MTPFSNEAYRTWFWIRCKQFDHPLASQLAGSLYATMTLPERMAFTD